MATHYDRALRLYKNEKLKYLEAFIQSHKQKLYNAKKEVGNQTDYVKAIKHLIKEEHKRLYPWANKEKMGNSMKIDHTRMCAIDDPETYHIKAIKCELLNQKAYLEHYNNTAKSEHDNLQLDNDRFKQKFKRPYRGT